jgi:hypothetical protein
MASKMAGLGVVTEEKSTFDGAIIVNVSPQWLYDPDGSFGNSVKLGARWSNKSPDHVALVLHSSGYISLQSIDININGDIKSFKSNSLTMLDNSGYNTVSKTIYTESQNSIVIPYQILEDMVSAKDCRLRIHTSKGYEDANFLIERMPGGQGTAILSIKEFMAKVGAHKKG